MKFFKNILNKKDDDLSPEELEELNFTIAKSKNANLDEKEEKILKLDEIISTADINLINKIRNMLDNKEKELTGKVSDIVEETTTPQNQNKAKEFSGEVDIKENITEKDLDDKTLDINQTPEQENQEEKEIEEAKYIRPQEEEQKKENNQNKPQVETKEEKPQEEKEEKIEKPQEEEKENQEEIKEIEKEIKTTPIEQEEQTNQKETNQEEEENKQEQEQIQAKEISEEKQKEIMEGESPEKIPKNIPEKIKSFFGEENISILNSTSSKYDLIKGNNITYIGIKDKNAFTNPITQTEQTTWFVSKIKQLEELQNFKILNSEEGIKDLVWQKENETIVICFRTTEKLENENDFTFPL